MSADARSSAKTRIPRLREGLRLTRSEFMRRWEAMPELKFAERIEGKVSIMTPPISLEHSDPHGFLMWCLITYRMATPGTRHLAETTTHVDGDNDFQPDTGLFIEPDHGGQTRYIGKYLEGAPELVVEVAETTVRKDLGTKFEVYRRAGVLEYIVCQTKKQLISCFTNREGQFESTEIVDGVFKSSCFPGLWIDFSALLAGDLDKVQATLAAGLEQFTKSLALDSTFRRRRQRPISLSREAAIEHSRGRQPAGKMRTPRLSPEGAVESKSTSCAPSGLAT